MVLFGGYNGQPSSDTWEWNGALWTLRPVAGPAPRYSHAMTYDSARRCAVMFGGIRGTTVFSDTWEYYGRRLTGPAPGDTAME